MGKTGRCRNVAEAASLHNLHTGQKDRVSEAEAPTQEYELEAIDHKTSDSLITWSQLFDHIRVTMMMH